MLDLGVCCCHASVSGAGTQYNTSSAICMTDSGKFVSMFLGQSPSMQGALDLCLFHSCPPFQESGNKFARVCLCHRFADRLMYLFAAHTQLHLVALAEYSCAATVEVPASRTWPTPVSPGTVGSTTVSMTPHWRRCLANPQQCLGSTVQVCNKVLSGAASYYAALCAV